jgi:hypothetical protein
LKSEASGSYKIIYSALRVLTACSGKPKVMQVAAHSGNDFDGSIPDVIDGIFKIPLAQNRCIAATIILWTSGLHSSPEAGPAITVPENCSNSLLRGTESRLPKRRIIPVTALNTYSAFPSIRIETNSRALLPECNAGTNMRLENLGGARFAEVLTKWGNSDLRPDVICRWAVPS